MAASGLVLYLVIAAAELERYCEPRLKSARKREANSLMANRACLKTAQSAGSEPATTGLRPVAQPMLGLTIVKLSLYFIFKYFDPTCSKSICPRSTKSHQTRPESVLLIILPSVYATKSVLASISPSETGSAS